jgi:hypothetical protein
VAHAAHVHEEQGAILGGVVAEHDAETTPAGQPRQSLLAVGR